MENSQTPGGTEFDRLLAAMPVIAEAVNKFNDPETGRAAFDSVMSAREARNRGVGPLRAGAEGSGRRAGGSSPVISAAASLVRKSRPVRVGHLEIGRQLGHLYQLVGPLGPEDALLLVLTSLMSVTNPEIRLAS